MNLATPPFRVLPWDFFAADNAPLPHVEALHISGAPRAFELLKRGTRVYFRLRDDNARVWATLDDDDDADFVRTFRRALGSGRIGRVIERGQWQIYRPEYEQIGKFQFLVSARGELQMRPWCSMWWHTISRAKSVALSSSAALDLTLAADWTPRLGSDELSGEDWYELQDDTPDEETKALTQMRFVRGDALTLDRLTAPFLRANRLNTQDFDPISSSSPARHPTLNVLILEHVYPAPLYPLIAELFAIAGVNWPSDFRYWPASYWETPGPSYSARVRRTAHDELEDFLFLRAWLADRCTPTQVKDILKFVQP